MAAIPRWRNKRWMNDNRVQFDTTRMMVATVGSHGIRPAELTAAAKQVKAVHANLARQRAEGSLPFFDLPYQDLSPVHAIARDLCRRFRDFVLIGIGGSALGPKATQEALRPPFYNLMSHKERGNTPRFFVLENVDPDSVAAVLGVVDPRRTCFNVVTKSGGTAETLANFMIARDWLARHVEKPEAHLIGTTDPVKGDLRAVAEAEGWRTLAVPPAVGGRFSQLTPVGLLPAAVCGIDIEELLAGAADMDQRTRSADLEQNPAYLLAVLHYLADTRKGKPISVMMPYADSLRTLSDWFVQLWAESLGKAKSLTGEAVHTGQTPIPAVGAVDQHSQLQLFVEGPNDKMVTFLRVDAFGEKGNIPKLYKDVSGLGYLGGKSLTQLINAEQAATEQVLTEHGRPNMRITLPRVNAFTLGQMFYLFEVMTAFGGGLYGVNPFDQPGVEHGKILTYGAMGRKGYANTLKAS